MKNGIIPWLDTLPPDTPEPNADSVISHPKVRVSINLSIVLFIPVD